MNIIKRTCANCVAFNPSATDDEEICSNLTSFTAHRFSTNGRLLIVHLAPSPDDWCDGHQTHEEDKAEDAAIAGFWQRLGIERRADGN